MFPNAARPSHVSEPASPARVPATLRLDWQQRATLRFLEWELLYGGYRVLSGKRGHDTLVTGVRPYVEGWRSVLGRVRTRIVRVGSRLSVERELL